ncbi:MAG TPA: nickel pincer cofactor biosynthesis protein LarB [Bacteroidota bacterium]
MKQKRRTPGAGSQLRNLVTSTANIAEMAKVLSSSSSIAVRDYADVDISRFERTSFPEIIYCENKRIDQITAIAKRLYTHKKLVLGTRCPPEFFPKLRKTFRGAHFNQDARCFRIGKPLPPLAGVSVGIISAGTTDIGACEEAALILETLGVEVRRIYDVGVAGIHRLFANDDRIKQCDVLVVAAGMEGALPSVIGGMYHQPIIAIPTSVGYGTSLAGFTALFAMLTSCSPGVTVVNINNGVGAAAATFKILKLLSSKRRT